jgi:hypothetical protein
MSGYQETERAVAALARWQAELFGAGAAQRMAPVAERFGSALTAQWFQEGLAALWAAPGALDADAAVRVLRTLDQSPEVGDEDGTYLECRVAEALVTLTSPLRVARGDDSAVTAALMCAPPRDVCGEIDAILAGSVKRRWWMRRTRRASPLHDAETAAQKECLRILDAHRDAPGDAAARIRELSQRRAADLATALAADVKWPDLDLDRVGWDGSLAYAVAAPPADGVIVASGGPVQTDAAGRAVVALRVGDVLGVSCPFAAAEVTTVRRSIAVVTWPWPGPHGQVAFPLDELHLTAFRTEPGWHELRADGTCLVGIPPSRLYVGGVHVYRQPVERDTGRLRVIVGVAPCGTPPVVDLVPQGYAFEPYGPEPVRVELLMRPYAFLADGDVVVDTAGASWRFRPPYWFTGPHGAGPSPEPGPVWPLTLTERDGHTPAPDAVAAVAEATADGSHDAVLAAWQAASDVDPAWIGRTADGSI